MKNENLHIDSDRKEEANQFPEIDLQYTVSKAEAWENLSRRIDALPSKPVIVSLKPILRMALAASLLLMIGTTGFLRFYTKTVYTPAARHLSFCFPDSSSIELNAQSTMSYHPYWYRLSRTITLDGEAFFKVIKGNQFKVVSQRGETTVLGTSFNIYSRNSEYSVTCFTGKVKVISSEKSERVLLNPNEQAYINKDGFLRFVQEVNPQAAKSWTDNMFVFTGASIIAVLQEIERQYDIKIKFKADSNLTYTGNFSKYLSEKEVLRLVCTSLGLTFEVQSDKVFLVD